MNFEKKALENHEPAKIITSGAPTSYKAVMLNLIGKVFRTLVAKQTIASTLIVTPMIGNLTRSIAHPRWLSGNRSWPELSVGLGQTLPIGDESALD